MICTLATGYELQIIRQVAIDYQPVQPNIPNVSLMWMGLASEPVEFPNLDVGGDFRCIDGCTPYTPDVFINPTNARDQSTYESVIPDFVADANESSDVGEHDRHVFWAGMFLGIIDFDSGAIVVLLVDAFFSLKLPAI